MSQPNRTTRRQFLTRSAQGVALLGTASGLGYLLSREEASTAAASTLIRTGARRARKIAVGADDRIHVAADRSLLTFDADGSRLAEIRLPRPARCIAARENGELLVGMIDRVEGYAPDGRRLAVWDVPAENAVLGSIAVGRNEVFVADAGNGVVWRYDGSGRLLGNISDRRGFAAPAEFCSLAVAGEGVLHVANPGRHRIETWSSNGELLSHWGERSRQLTGFGGCCNPVSFALVPDGRFVTAERGQPRVKLYDAAGRFESLLAGPDRFTDNAAASGSDDGPGCSSGGLDVAVDSRRRVLVLDRVTGDVSVFV